MKSLMLLWREAANELAAWCGTSTTLDCKTIERRIEHEGLSFLTITLPAFGKDFEKSLDQGFVDHTSFTSFKRKGGLPLFLGGFLDRVFDRRSGLLLGCPDIDAIFSVRQLTLMFGKILIECSEERTKGAVSQYVQCEQEIKQNDRSMSLSLLQDFEQVALLLFRDVFSAMDTSVYNGDVVPKHGPGRTADRLSGNGKFDQTEWPSRLERIFPFGEYAIPNWRFNYLLDHVDFLEPGMERPVRVVTVPKTLKTPRIIAIEPTAMQYMQQSLMEMFVEKLEADKTVSSFVGFTSSVPNQDMARQGSLKGDLATLDLSEASDRVSNQHVRTMFRRFPWLAEAIDATRSRKAEVPGHGVIRLAKFASMGSALTFPIEELVFITLVFMGISKELNKPLTRKDIKSFVGKVRVYGDDIIVPVDYVSSVHGMLETFGYRVNSSKSFWTGQFRESCGKEYYAGEDVSIVRVRRTFPTAQIDVPEIISLVALRNNFYEIGLWTTARYLETEIGKYLPHYPTVFNTSPLLGRHSYFAYDSKKVDSDTHAPVIKGYVVKPKPPTSKVSGEGALLKWFLKRGEQPFADRDHLERQGRPEAVCIKLRWAQPF